MSTQRQRDANRRNARLSTGPVTPEGKARVALNSVTHGFTARDAVTPCENRQDFLDLLTSLEAELNPAGPLERFFVNQMACAHWRLNRVVRIETGLITSTVAATARRERVVAEDETDQDDDDTRPDPNPEPATPLTPDQQHAEETRLLGKTFAHNTQGDPYAKLFRYENTIRRGFYKALENLRHAQARRTEQK